MRAVALVVAAGTMLIALIGIGGPAAASDEPSAPSIGRPSAAEPGATRTPALDAGNGGLAH